MSNSPASAPENDGPQKPAPRRTEPPLAGGEPQAEPQRAAAAGDREPSADLDQPASAEAGDVQEEIRRLNDRLLRTQAELENYQKRSRREIESERRYAALPLARDLLGVLDNLERAIEAAELNENSAGLLQGVKMVAAQLHSVLEQHHCKRIEAEGQPFDPHLHEALMQEASEEHPAGQVTRVFRAGYLLHDRVIRPSQVHVSSGAPQADQDSP